MNFWGWGEYFPHFQDSGDVFQYTPGGQTGTQSACCMWPQEKQVCHTPRPTLCFLVSEIGRTLNTVQKHKLLQASG